MPVLQNEARGLAAAAAVPSAGTNAPRQPGGREGNTSSAFGVARQDSGSGPFGENSEAAGRGTRVGPTWSPPRLKQPVLGVAGLRVEP